jgi:hypothetical protein
MTFEIPTTVDIPDGTYIASLAEVKSDQGQFGPMRRWSFLVEHEVDGHAQIDELTVLTSANTGPQSKSYQWLTALLGEAPKAGTVVESPTGKRCTVTITHNEKGFPTISAVGPYVDPQQQLPGIPR